MSGSFSAVGGVAVPLPVNASRVAAKRSWRGWNARCSSPAIACFIGPPFAAPTVIVNAPMPISSAQSTANAPDIAPAGTSMNSTRPSANEPSSHGSVFHGPRDRRAGTFFAARRRHTNTAPTSIASAATKISLSSHGE